VNEYARKTSHLLFGIGIAALIYLVPKVFVLPIIGISLVVGLGIIDLVMKGYHIPGIHFVLKNLERPEQIPGKGAFYFVFAALVVTILFPTLIAAASVLVLAVQDGFATIVGIAIGKHRIWNGKSYEGFAAGSIAGIIVLLPWFSPVAAVCAGLLAGLVELVSPVDDNLIVPFPVAILLSYIPV
jgi:phytol kinase